MPTQYEAPYVNGVREDLTQTKKDTLTNQLKAIREAFVPTYEQPVLTTHYLVVEHTKKHGAQQTFTQLNGDTAEYLLAIADAPEELIGTNPPPVEGM